MKEVLGIICAVVSVISAVVAIDAMNKCAEVEEKKKSKEVEIKEDEDIDLDCSNDCDVYEDLSEDDIPDVEYKVDTNADEPTKEKTVEEGKSSTTEDNQ